MGEALSASVPFRRIERMPADLPTRLIVSGMTVGGRLFSLLAVPDDGGNPWLLLTLHAEHDGASFFRVPLATLVGRLAEGEGLARVPLDDQAVAALDVLRGALAGMELETASDGSVSGLDLFGPALDGVVRFASAWAEREAGAAH